MHELICLDNNSPEIIYLCNKDKRLAKVISMVGPISYQVHNDDYAFLVHEIIEQMLSIKAGTKIYERLVFLCDGNISPSSVNKLSDSDIRSTGTSTPKVSYIRALTDAVMDGRISFEDYRSMSDQEVIRSLTSIKGIGLWSAKMYLIFVLNRQDILPYEDSAFLQSFCWMHKTTDRSKHAVEEKCRKWKPYSSIAARYMYRALDMGLTKQEFHLFK